ncbi:MAG: response regulator, partial [Cyanobacteria bacterium P01_A01_bin.135]
LNGRVTVTSTPGEGTTFTLLLPLTLTMLDLLICFVGSSPLAFRSSGITEIIIPKPGQTSTSGDQRFLHWQGKTLPIYDMDSLLTYNCLLPETPPSRVLSAVPSPADWDSPMLILERDKETVVLQVDRLVTEQELVVKPFGKAIAPPSYAYGCTVLGDGSLVPVMDGLVFLDTILARHQEAGVRSITEALERTLRADSQQDVVQITEAVTLLVIDDAVTSRRTLALSLERAGYRVLQARDGQEGIEQLEQNPDVQLIVCDVEMPNMNGFEFLTHRRQAPAIAHIPTVMLTSRSNDKHRWLAKQLGATDYFTKPYLEQEFLGAIATHLQAAGAELASATS